MSFSDPTAFWALVVSVFALCAAAASAAFAGLTWRQDGAIVRVEIRMWILVSYPKPKPGEFSFAPRSVVLRNRRDWETWVQPDGGTGSMKFIQVVVRNLGRTPIEIDDVGISNRNAPGFSIKRAGGLKDIPDDPETPITLAPYTSLSWLYAASDAASYARGEQWFTGYAADATGRTTTSEPAKVPTS